MFAADPITFDAVAAERRFQWSEAHLAGRADGPLQHILQRTGQRLVPATSRVFLIELQEKSFEYVGCRDAGWSDGLVRVLEHV